jgi:uncharacterized protein
MKTSRYNLFIHHIPDNAYIGFNSVSGGVLIFTPIQYDAAQKILRDPNQTLSKKESELMDMLLKSRFLINDNVDELKILKVRNNLARYDGFTLGLIIVPTLICNFECPYCYVDRDKIKMGVDTIEKIKKFVLKNLENINKLQVCWTGGEPLLAIDIVEELNNFFIKETQARQKKFSCSMVTNGYLLEKENIERLKKCGIISLQITIDGYEDYHDKLRFTRGGGKTYKQVLKNLVSASKANIKIMLRSNVNMENWEGIYKLIDDLASQDLNNKMVKFTPCKVVGEEGSNGLCNLFSTKDFAKLEPQLIEYALKKGIITNIIDMGTVQTFCGANRLKTYVVDPYANLLKCWCNLGDIENNKIGYLKDDGDAAIDFPEFAEWMGWDPFEIEECKKCQVLPLCMGGCKYYNVTEKTNCTEIGCTHRKYNLEEMLKLYYLKLTRYNAQPWNKENDNKTNESKITIK